MTTDGEVIVLVNVTVFVLQAALCSVFLVAVAAKIADWETSIQWITQLGVRKPAPTLIAVLVIETTMVAAVAIAPNLGAIGGLAFITGATVVLYVAKGKGLDCSCFGSSHRVTARSFVRNGLIAAGFLALAAVGPAAASPSASDTAAAVLAIAVVAPAVRAVLTIRILERVT